MTDATPQPQPARSVGKVVEIGAPVEAVWAALTTPEGLRNFYCDWAEVTPGVCGTFQIGWHGFGGLPVATIEAWEPGARLRIHHPAAPGESVTTAEEWTLWAEGDHTVVRLVYEGFGEGDDWDEFYDSFDATSALVVDLLATWLGPAGGAPLAKVNVDVPVAGDRAVAWAQALGPDFTGDDGRPAAVAPGTAVTVALPGGEPLAGTALHVAPASEALVGLGGAGESRLVVVARPGPAPGTTRLLLEVYAWGIDDAVRAADQARLDAAADALAHHEPGTTAAHRAATPPDPREGPMSTTPYVPEGSPALIPYLCCKDAASAIDFYVEVFGAGESSERFVDGDGKVGHAELEVGGSPFYLADTFPDMGVEAPIPGRSGASFCVYVPDVDASVAKAVARGATVLEPAKETFYGTRRSTIEDPYGHRWLVGTHIRNVSEREYQQAVDGFAQT